MKLKDQVISDRWARSKAVQELIRERSGRVIDALTQEDATPSPAWRIETVYRPEEQAASNFRAIYPIFCKMLEAQKNAIDKV